MEKFWISFAGAFWEKWSITKTFLEHLGFLIVKNYLSLQVVTSIWLKEFNMHLCLRFVFFLRKPFSWITTSLMRKSKQWYVLEALTKCHYVLQALICECQKVNMIFLH